MARISVESIVCCTLPTGLLCIQHAALGLLHCLPHIVAAISQPMQDAAHNFAASAFNLWARAVLA